VISTKKKCTQLISIHMSNRTQVYMDVRCMVMEQRAMIQIFMVFPSKVGAPGHVSGMCSSLWTTWARKKVPEVNICIWEVHFGGCGGTGGPTAVRTSFAIVLICPDLETEPGRRERDPPPRLWNAAYARRSTTRSLNCGHVLG
jgi:hypothetical protein